MKYLGRALLISLLVSAFVFCASPGIREEMDDARTYNGYEFLTMFVEEQLAPTSAALVWYADNIMGYSSIAIAGFEVSTGSVPTTISAQALKPDRTALNVAAQIITVGTDLTLFQSPWYSFTLDAIAVTRSVSFVFNIAD